MVNLGQIRSWQAEADSAYANSGETPFFLESLLNSVVDENGKVIEEEDRMFVTIIALKLAQWLKQKSTYLPNFATRRNSPRMHRLIEMTDELLSIQRRFQTDSGRAIELGEANYTIRRDGEIRVFDHSSLKRKSKAIMEGVAELEHELGCWLANADEEYRQNLAVFKSGTDLMETWVGKRQYAAEQEAWRERQEAAQVYNAMGEPQNEISEMFPFHYYMVVQTGDIIDQRIAKTSLRAAAWIFKQSRPRCRRLRDAVWEKVSKKLEKFR